jgi:multimeric flavodoxin WrbA
MQITVLNGSPKGMTSVTMQYVLFLQKKHPQHEFRILNICHDIKNLEDNQAAFQEAIAAIQASDAVLWATPVYVLLVPGPYKRFIELVFERSAHSAFQGKYAATLTTSVRFFDHTAHAYLNAISDDLGMHYVGAYSAEMFDLLKEEEQKRLLFFWQNFLSAAEERRPMQKSYGPVATAKFGYTPGEIGGKVSVDGRKILVLADADNGDAAVNNMVRRFCECFTEPVEVINLHEIKIRGGCLGCIQCSFDNVCVYRDADDVHAVYRKMRDADVVIHAGGIKDRFFSARWKTLLDRGFFNNHVPILAGKQIGYLVSGPLSQLPNLREVLEAFAEIGQTNLIGIVTDECSDSRELDRLLDGFARRTVECAAARYVRPMTFLGKGGKKVLRDEIWSGMRFVFPLDHQYYKRHGMYDFPKRSLKKRITETFFGLLLKIPSFRKQFQAKMKEGMIEPLVEVVERA